jgi:hypothetical protein
LGSYLLLLVLLDLFFLWTYSTLFAAMEEEDEKLSKFEILVG